MQEWIPPLQSFQAVLIGGQASRSKNVRVGVQLAPRISVGPDNKLTMEDASMGPAKR